MPAIPQGKAEHVISVWLGGGMGQVDTFDPERRGDPKLKVAGSYYDSIPTAVDGVQLCEHLSKLAPLMDRVTAVRTVNHKVIDEHAAATNWMHVGAAGEWHGDLSFVRVDHRPRTRRGRRQRRRRMS